MRFELLISLEKSSRNEGCWRIYANYEIRTHHLQNTIRSTNQSIKFLGDIGI